MPHLKIDTINVYYELYGDEHKPYLLLIHGLGSSVRDWELQVPSFIEDYHVLAIDMRGHGRSDKPREKYSMRQFSNDVFAVMDALKIEKAHILGISMGGMIAFQMAVDCPERIQSLIIVNSAPAVIPRNFQDKLGVFLRHAVVRVLGMRRMAEVGAPRLFPGEDFAELRQIFIERWGENEPQAYLNALDAIVGWSVEAQIHSICVPTLILTADQDYTSVAYKEAYLAKMPAARLYIIPDAHHAVSSERPEAFNAAVLDFLHSL